MMYRFLLGSFLVLALMGCDPSPILSISQEVEGNWNYDEPLNYTLDIQDNEKVYDLVLSLRYATDFGYQNIYVNIITTYPDGNEVEDIVSLNIMDDSGSFLGECNGEKCDTEIILQENFKFEQTGIHKIAINQYSREPNLEDIFGADLKLFEVEK